MRKFLLVALLASLTAGCGILYRQPIYQGSLIDKSAVEQLQVGMTQDQVQGLLGSPSIADPFHHDRWDYTATMKTGRTGRIEKKNFTVFFENGAATRWEGDYFPEMDSELAAKVRRQFGPNLAKDKKKQRRGG